MVYAQYVESGKPLISHRHPKPKETPSSQSDLFGAYHQQGTQHESPHYRQQLVKQERELGARGKQYSTAEINVIHTS